MDKTVTKNNKENAKPVACQKTIKSRNVVSKPLQSKNDLKQENWEGNPEEKTEFKEQVGPLTKTKFDPKNRKTLSQAFRTEQSVRHRKLVEQKPPSTLPPKPVPGTYKGRVVKSKIDCFRRPHCGEVKIGDGTAVAGPGMGALSKAQSKSVTVLPGSKSRLQPNLSSRAKSVSDVQLNVAEKPAQRSVSQRQMSAKAPASTRPVVPRLAPVPPKPAPAPAARPVSSKPSLLIKKREPVVQSYKAKPAVTTSEHKGPGPSATSQYRVHVETADQRRAKLAVWLASKGKTLKRPAMTEKSAPEPLKLVPRHQARQESAEARQESAEARQESAEARQESAEARQESAEARQESAEDDETQLEKVLHSKPVFSSSPTPIINTTLDLLDNSEMDLPVDPEIRMESLVLNLCEKLDAMETPSSCENNPHMGQTVEAEILNVNVEEETAKEYEILEEEDLEINEDLVNVATVDELEVENESKEKVLEQKQKKLIKDEDEERKMDSTPTEVTGASVVKYSVKTTPFLQSVKKRIEDQSVPGSGPRRKSAIKDLKFLTPVRRSSRIQRKSSRLPGMLSEHDPCVSSLAELVQLDDADANAYIYRRNPALLDHLPDHPRDLERLSAEIK
ncbi:cytoskeleton-associated protein 2 isoform X2 [Brachyhypopomus gauderio]|uniref:cytoskeleton-associated protein 2 isoform X2 n=1 Tax=Brachyhypopomus gauderio TaxID=698409 RepID=UPI004043190B